MERNTVQRQIILNTIHKFGHIKLNDLYVEVKNDFPTISLSTVYRNIDALEKENKLRKIPNKVGSDYIEDISLPFHNHFICTKCNRVFDLMDEKTIPAHYDEHGNYIEETNIIKYGICKECLENNK